MVEEVIYIEEEGGDGFGFWTSVIRVGSCRVGFYTLQVGADAKETRGLCQLLIFRLICFFF